MFVYEVNDYLHYNILSKGYVDKFNNREGDVDYNKAGALLHNLFWGQMRSPKINNLPTGAIGILIDQKFSDYSTFLDQIIKTATDFKGSGWVYLSKTGAIKTLVNQSFKDDILLPIDIWEHSYILDYEVDKKSYIRSLMRLIDWNVINDRIILNSN